MSISVTIRQNLEKPPGGTPPAGPRSSAALPWIMHMRWSKLLFMHWPVSKQALRELVPPGLEVDAFEGQAWLGVVPFRMSNVRPRFLPAMPGLSAFPELNVRTYVTRDGRPGVWFFSLDATSSFAVRTARRLWHLPYFDASMRAMQNGDEMAYRSVRTHRGAAPASIALRYGPCGPAVVASANTLEDFLTNRLCLYSASPAGVIYRGTSPTFHGRCNRPGPR